MTEDFEHLTAADFKAINQMTDEEVVDEIVRKQRNELEKMSTEHLRQVMIDYRVSMYRHRLIKEAGLEYEGQMKIRFGLGQLLFLLLLMSLFGFCAGMVVAAGTDWEYWGK